MLDPGVPLEEYSLLVELQDEHLRDQVPTTSERVWTEVEVAIFGFHERTLLVSYF
jgi:hypothetical protein